MSRTHYWTCSKFADWVRGTKKLSAGTSEEWNEWTTSAKIKHNFRYWLAEEGLDYLQKIVYYIPDVLYSVKYYINNRYITKTHALTAHGKDIKPGNWCDVGRRFLPCLFNELQDFVEIEKAWIHIVWDNEAVKKYNAPFYASGWFRWRTWRCPQAGLDRLNWEASLKFDDQWMDKNDPVYGQPTPQALNAMEILSLYKWWTETYRNRPEPMDASGWSAYCNACRDELGGGVMSMLNDAKSPALKKQGDKAHKLLYEIEDAYEKEDTEMLVRLIKVRKSLWT